MNSFCSIVVLYCFSTCIDVFIHIVNEIYILFAGNSKEMQRLIQHHIEASKIGRQIAEELVDTQRCTDDASPVQSMESRSEPHIQTGIHDVSLLNRIMKCND